MTEPPTEPQHPQGPRQQTGGRSARGPVWLVLIGIVVAVAAVGILVMGLLRAGAGT